MFKKLTVGFMLFLISIPLTNASCYDLNNSYKNYSSESSRYFDLYIATSYKDTETRNGYYSQYTQYKSLSNNAYTDYNSCVTNAISIYNIGIENYNKKYYDSAANYFEQYISLSGDASDAYYSKAKELAKISYGQMGALNYGKKDYRGAVDNLLKALNYDPRSYSNNFTIAAAYSQLKEMNNAGYHAKLAKDNAGTFEQIEDAQKMIDDIDYKIKTANDKLNAPSNDTISYLQYYIKDLNIQTAWTQIANPKQVIVAIIDDGININHPDLTKNIWISQNNTYGSSKIISFQNDGLVDNATAGEHGTMVAGIIGATTNNNEGIAGIAKNVKLMPIRIFDTNGDTKEEYIIQAINFAIDNNANIINMSLGGSQFKYSKGMDEAIKRAYDRGIFVVISGGNGDTLANRQNGVNLDINPISPVCNNKGQNYSFGVFATNKEGIKTLWTNYGKCTPFFAPGEEIVSTSVPSYNKELGINYNQLDGTSFSAPIVSGILALGYNKYGKIPYSVAYSSLAQATTINIKGNQILDANKYLTNLQSYYDNQNIKRLDGLKKKAQIQLDNYKRQYIKFSANIQKTKYQSLISVFQKRSKALRGDNLTVNNLIIELINNEISKL